jgi:type II secretory pathway pseudopilin PulG
MKRALLRVLAALGILIMLAGIGFVVWGSTPQAASDEALQALVSDSHVRVETEP